MYSTSSNILLANSKRPPSQRNLQITQHSNSYGGMTKPNTAPCPTAFPSHSSSSKSISAAKSSNAQIVSKRLQRRVSGATISSSGADSARKPMASTGYASKKRRPGAEANGAAPLSSLPLNVYNNKTQVLDASNNSSVGTSKAKPSVFPTRVSTTLRNIQPIRQQVKEANASRYGSNKGNNSQSIKKSVNERLNQLNEKNQIELRNCKENTRTSGQASFTRMPPSRNDNTRRRKDQAEMTPTGQKIKFNGDLSLTSPDTTPQIQHQSIQPVPKPEPSKDALSDSSFEREENAMPPKKMEVNRSIGPSTEDGDAYCVDDEEDDEDDDFEREQPSDHVKTHQSQQQLLELSRRTSQQSNKIVNLHSRGGSLGSDHGFQHQSRTSQRGDIGVTGYREMTVESRQRERAETTPKGSRRDSHLGQTHQVDSQKPKLEDQHMIQPGSAGEGFVRRTQGLVKDYEEAAQSEQKVSKRVSDLNTHTRNQPSKSFMEDNNYTGSTEYDKFANQNLPRVVEEMNSTNPLDESTIKSPEKNNDRNYLLPVSTEKKSRPSATQAAVYPEMTMDRCSVGRNSSQDSRNQGKIQVGASSGAVLTGSTQNEGETPITQVIETQVKENELIEEDKFEEQPTVDDSKVQTQVQAAQADQSFQNQTKDTNKETEERLSLDEFKEYEENVKMTMERETSVISSGFGAIPSQMHSSLDHAERKSFDPKMSQASGGKMNSTIGARSNKSNFSSQISKTTPQRKVDDNSNSPFRAVLAHQARAQNFSFPKGSRGLIPPERQRNAQRNLSHHSKKRTTDSKDIESIIDTEKKSQKQSNKRYDKSRGKSSSLSQKRHSRKQSSISGRAQALSASSSNQQSKIKIIKSSTSKPELAGDRNSSIMNSNANKHISSIPTQESIVSFAGHQVAMEQPTNMFTQPVQPAPQPPSVTHQSATTSSNEVAVAGIDSGEQMISNLTDEGSLNDTRKRLLVFNQTTNLQQSAVNLLSLDCKSSKMFNSSSLQSSGSMMNHRRIPLGYSSYQVPAGMTPTLQQIAEQALAYGTQEGHGGDKAVSQTSGTQTYYVDDVSSSPNLGQSLNQTEQKIQFSFCNNSNKATFSNQYCIAGNQFVKQPTQTLKEDLGVCNFEVTLQTQQKEESQLANTKNSRMSSISNTMSPMSSSKNAPQPSNLACMPQSAHAKEQFMVHQRIQQQERMLMQRQLEIDQQNRVFKGKVEAARAREYERRRSEDERRRQWAQNQVEMMASGSAWASVEGNGLPQSQEQCKVALETDANQVFTVGSCEEGGSVGEQAMAQYLQTNQCSLQTAKFNDQQAQGSLESSGGASQWVSESINLIDKSKQMGAPGVYIDEDGGAQQSEFGKQLPFSPSTHQYVTATGFDERIDLIGHGEIRNMESTQNADSSALSNTLPLQSQNLSQMFRDMKSNRQRESSTEQQLKQAEVRSDEEIIQEAINSIATHLPSPNEAQMGTSVHNSSVGQLCMNYNEYLEKMQHQRAAQTIDHPTSFGNSPKSIRGPDSLKRSSCSVGSIGRQVQRSNNATAQSSKYCPILRSNSLSSKPGTKRGKPAATTSVRGKLPPWNNSVNAQSTRHRRAKSQTSRPFPRTVKSSASTPGVQQPLRNGTRSCTGIQAQGKRAASEKERKPNNGQRNKNAKPMESRGSGEGTSGKIKRRKSEAKKAVVVKRQPGYSHDFDYQLESQTLEMSYLKREMRAAQQEDEQQQQHVNEVREMVNGRKQVYANLDRARYSEMQEAIEKAQLSEMHMLSQPISCTIDSANYLNERDRQDGQQNSTVEYLNCYGSGQQPLTFESKNSHGYLQRQLLGSFNEGVLNLDNRVHVLHSDKSLDLNTGSQQQPQGIQSMPVYHRTIPDDGIREHDYAAAAAALRQSTHPNNLTSTSELHQQKESVHSDYNDFVRLNHLSRQPGYPLPAALSPGLDPSAGFDPNMTASQEPQSAATLGMTQFAMGEQTRGEQEQISMEQEIQEQPEEKQTADDDPQLPEENPQVITDELMLSGSIENQTVQSRNAINTQSSLSRSKSKQKSRKRDSSATKLDLNPLASPPDDYVKVVKKRVKSRKRRSSSTEYTRRYLSHARNRPPRNRNSSFFRSHLSLSNLPGRKQDPSVKFGKRRSASHMNTCLPPMENGTQSAMLESLENCMSQGHFHSQIQDQQSVQGLNNHVMSQKHRERQLLEKHMGIKKQQIMQTKKQVGLMRNGNQAMFERTRKRRQNVEKLQKDRKIIANNKCGEERQIEGVVQDLGELQRLRQTLREEMEVESQLVDDIRSIVHKYKRLVAEQTREKEKLAQAVRGQQRKILRNLKERKQVLQSDNEKLYTDFKSTVTIGSTQTLHRQSSSNIRHSRSNSRVRSKSRGGIKTPNTDLSKRYGAVSSVGKQSNPRSISRKQSRSSLGRKTEAPNVGSSQNTSLKRMMPVYLR